MGVRTSGSVISSQGGDTGRLFGPSTESGRASVVHTVVHLSIPLLALQAVLRSTPPLPRVTSATFFLLPLARL